MLFLYVVHRLFREPGIFWDFSSSWNCRFVSLYLISHINWCPYVKVYVCLWSSKPRIYALWSLATFFALDNDNAYSCLIAIYSYASLCGPPAAYNIQHGNTWPSCKYLSSPPRFKRSSSTSQTASTSLKTLTSLSILQQVSFGWSKLASLVFLKSKHCMICVSRFTTCSLSTAHPLCLPHEFLSLNTDQKILFTPCFYGEPHHWSTLTPAKNLSFTSIHELSSPFP